MNDPSYGIDTLPNHGNFPEKVNILLVDDHPANLFALSTVLAQPDYNLIQATSGKEALSHLLKYEFAVVLLDVMMPGIDGFELAQIMKSKESTRHIPIIFVTAVANDISTLFEGYSIGAVDYLLKPYEPKIIRAKVAVFAELFRKTEFIKNSQKAEFLKKEQEGRIRAENAEERFKDLTNSLDHAIIWEANLDLSYFTFISDRVENLLGFPKSKWLQEQNFFYQVLYPADQLAIFNVLQHLNNPDYKADVLGERCDHRMITSAKSERWFHTGIQLLKNTAGVPVGTRGLSVDIHSLKGVEQALRDSQEQLDFALKAARMGMWDWNLITGNFSASETLKWMFGFSSLDFPRNVEAIRARIHPDDRELHLKTINQVINSQENYDLEYRIILPDGNVRWISSKGRSFFDSHQKPIRMAGTVTDITERKEAEEQEKFLSRATLELASSIDYNTTLQKIVDLLIPQFGCWCIIDLIEKENIHRAIVRHQDPAKLDLVREFEKLSPDLEAPSGASQAIRSGESVLFPPQDPNELPDDLRNIPMIGTKDPDQIKIIEKLGIRSYISVLIESRRIFIGVITLVRAEKMPVFKAKDLKFLEELARRAALAIDNARLYLNSQKSVRTREEVVSLVSHDLKNPLTSILMNGKIIEKTLPDNFKEKTKKLFDRIQYAARRMNDLIDNILDLAKIEAGGFSIQPAESNIDFIIDDTIDMMHLSLREANLKIEKQIDPRCRLVLCDPRQISRVLMNLLSNAIKFTPSGGTITLTVEHLLRETHISVSDTGSGIPQDQQHHIFDRFWQAKETARQGTGLGLSIAKGIVEAHNGKIWVESKVGVGTTFHFKIPNIYQQVA